MAETEIQPGPEQADVLAEIRKVLTINTETLGSLVAVVQTQTEVLREIHQWREEAGPLLDSRAELIGRHLEQNGESLEKLLYHSTQVHELLQKAAPLLESKAARVALGVERHPILSHLTGGGKRG